MANPIFPTALYRHRGLAADQHLTQDEWNQVGVEVATIESLLNDLLGNPAGEPGGGVGTGTLNVTQLSWGRTPIKGRLLDIAAAADLQIRTNWLEDGTADDPLQSGWGMRVGVIVDEVSLHRREPGVIAVTKELIRQTETQLYLNSKVGIGLTDPKEALDIVGAVRLSAPLLALPGTIAYFAGSFQGHNASGWVPLGPIEGEDFLPPTTVVAGSYGDATHIPSFIVDADGRLSFAEEIDLTTTGIPPGGPAGGSLQGTYPNPLLTYTGVTPGTYGGESAIPVLTITEEGRISGALEIPYTGPSGTTTGIEHELFSAGPDVITASTNKTLLTAVVVGAVTGDMRIAGSVQGRVIHPGTPPPYQGMHRTYLTFRVKVGGEEVLLLKRGAIQTYIDPDTNANTSTQIEIPFVVYKPIFLASTYDISIECSNYRDDDETSDSVPAGTYKMTYDIDFTQMYVEQLEHVTTALMGPVVTISAEGRVTAATSVPLVAEVGAGVWTEEGTYIHTTTLGKPVVVGTPDPDRTDYTLSPFVIRRDPAVLVGSPMQTIWNIDQEWQASSSHGIAGMTISVTDKVQANMLAMDLSAANWRELRFQVLTDDGGNSSVKLVPGGGFLSASEVEQTVIPIRQSGSNTFTYPGDNHRVQTSIGDYFLYSGGASSTSWISLGQFRMNGVSGDGYSGTYPDDGGTVAFSSNWVSPIRAWRYRAWGKFHRVSGIAQLRQTLVADTNLIVFDWASAGGDTWTDGYWMVEVELIFRAVTPWEIIDIPTDSYQTHVNMFTSGRLELLVDPASGTSAALSQVYVMQGPTTYYNSDAHHKTRGIDFLQTDKSLVLKLEGAFGTSNAGNLVECYRQSLEYR